MKIELIKVAHASDAVANVAYVIGLIGSGCLAVSLVVWLIALLVAATDN